MVNLRGIAAVVGLLAMVGVYIATIDVHWMVSVPNPNQPSNIFEMHQGLWEKCSTSNMNQQCQPYIGAITQLPGALIAQRAMMIMACGLGTIATLGAISSTNIVNAVKTSRGKGQVCCMAAVLYLATATLSIATVGWATFNIAVKHELDGGLMGGGYDYHLNTVHYTLGFDIYCGYVSGFLLLISSVALFFSGCSSDEEDEYEDYNMNETTSYQPGKSHV